MQNDDPVGKGEAKAASLLHLEATHREAEAAHTARIMSIRVAQSFGASWSDIGAATGMSRQAAHNRFAPFLRVRPSS